MSIPHNIFADMGLPNAEMKQAKALVSIQFEKSLRVQGLTQRQAAQKTGLTQPEVSKIVRGVCSGFTLDRMLSAIGALGHDVEIGFQRTESDQGRAASAVQSVVSKPWFWPAWNGMSAVWNVALWGAALFGVWFVISSAVHHFRGEGLDGVYEASDGFGDMTFWPDGTYLFRSMGIQLPGKYKVRNNSTVDMLAQYNSALHPTSNASPDAQAMGSFMGILASGMGDGVISPDKSTFEWQGHTFSLDHRPTTGPPAVPDPNAPEASPSAGAVPPSQMLTPTPQEIRQSTAKPGDTGEWGAGRPEDAAVLRDAPEHRPRRQRLGADPPWRGCSTTDASAASNGRHHARRQPRTGAEKGQVI